MKQEGELSMKKAVSIILIIITIFSLAACAANKLPEGFSEEEVLSKAKSVVTLLNEKNFEGVTELYSDVMNSDAAELEKALSKQLEGLGDFKDFSSNAVGASSAPEIGDFAVVILVCAYDNGKATYTISIDKDNRICGLFMK